MTLNVGEIFQSSGLQDFTAESVISPSLLDSWWLPPKDWMLWTVRSFLRALWHRCFSSVDACAQCGSWESGVGRGMSDQTVSHPTPKTNSQRHANEFPKARIGGNGGMLMGKAESGHVSGLFAHGLRPNSESRGRNSDAVRW